MVWEFWTKDDYTFYFQEQYLNGVDKDRWQKFKETLRKTDDPREFELTSCPSHSYKMVLEIPETEYFVAVRLHDKNNPHPDFGQGIILIKIGRIDDFKS